MKRILTILLIFALLGTPLAGNPPLQAYAAENTTEFAGGEGTMENPYRIETPAQLDNVRHYLGSCFVLSNDITFSAAHFNSSAGDQPAGENFYNTGMGWLAIGSESTPFTGHFDGNGYKICGIYAKAPQTYDKRGLFGVNAGTVTRLELVNGTLSFTSDYAYSMGSLVGSNAGTVDDCDVTMDLSAPQPVKGAYYYGGIAGLNAGLISGCTFSGNLEWTQDLSQSGVTSGAPMYGGGITGRNTGTITDCASNGICEVNNALYQHMGGVAGLNEGNILRSSNAMELSAGNDLHGYIAGIAASNTGVVDGCRNTARITGYETAGGIAATNSGRIERCSNSGDIAASFGYLDSHSAESAAGGIAGVSYSLVSKCYNTGAVSATASGYYIRGLSFGGGITGLNTGLIHAAYNTGTVAAYAASQKGAGGIAGSNGGTISDVYNIWAVGQTASYYGPIIGYDDGSGAPGLTNAYYMECPTGNSFGQPMEGWAMEYGYLYEGFDFDTVWTVEGNDAYALPELRDNEHAGTPVFQVRFDTQGGSAVSMANCVAGAMLTRPADPTRANYDFAGWYRDSACTEPWSFDSDPMPGYHFTLYGKWTPRVYHVSFDSQGGSAIEDKAAAYGEVIGEPEPPVREGYTFQYWRSGSGSIWRLDYQSMPGSDLQLYAVWSVNAYTVRYFENNGALGPVTKTCNYGASCEALAPVRTGYTLAGWYTEPEFLNAWNFGSDVMPARDLSLYAKWEPNQYTVLFNGNGGAGSLGAQTLTYDAAALLPGSPFTYTGYAFLGWATTPTGAVVYADKASVKNLTAANGATVTLYAKWGAPIVSAVSYNYNSIKVSWAAAGGATSYKIYRATSATGTYSLVYTASSTTRSWVNTGLVTGKYYYYKVYPVAGGKTYTHSTYKYAKPIPATPTVTVAKASTTSIKVTWTGVSGATKYQVYRATTATGTYALVYTATAPLQSWTNTGLKAGTTYYYKVRAYHLEGTTNVYGAYSTVMYLKL